MPLSQTATPKDMKNPKASPVRSQTVETANLKVTGKADSGSPTRKSTAQKPAAQLPAAMKASFEPKESPAKLNEPPTLQLNAIEEDAQLEEPQNDGTGYQSGQETPSGVVAENEDGEGEDTDSLNKRASQHNGSTPAF